MIEDNQKVLIHIGFPKTGSTFLQSYFEHHPAIHHNKERFQEYVYSGKITELVKEEINEHEVIDVLSEELLTIWSGDTTNVNFQTYDMNYEFETCQKRTAEQLHAFYPQSKILIVVRGYESLVASLYSQYILSGGTKSSKVFNQENEAMILKLYNYNKLIDLYRTLFSVEQVIILPFEMLQENPKQFLIHIEKSTGIDHFDFNDGIVHGSIPKNLIFFIRISTSIYKQYLQLLYRKKSQKKFKNYLEKVYRLKNNRLMKIFKGKIRGNYLSDSFIHFFTLNSSALSQIEIFNPYISKYREK